MPTFKARHLLAVCALLALLAHASAINGSEGTEGSCCATNADCTAPSHECRDNRCLATDPIFIPGQRPPPAQGSECTTQYECAANQVCSYGFCVAASSPYTNGRVGLYCLHQEDCFSPELICVDTQCTYKDCPATPGGTAGSCCASDAECTDTTYGPLRCEAGRCENVNPAEIPGPRPPAPQGNECVSSGQCGAGNECWFGFCRPIGFSNNNANQGLYCEHQEDCFSADLICVDTQCVLKSCVPPQQVDQAGDCCLSDAQCTSTVNGPLHCVAGHCQNVNSAQIPGPRPPAPQGSECTTKYDCAANFECWFGFCQPIGYTNNYANKGLYCERQEDCFHTDLICVDQQCVRKTCVLEIP